MKHIDSRILKARAQMIVEEPFWGTLAMHLRIVPERHPKLTTMATDGTSLFYNPGMFDRPGMTMKRIKMTWKHEVLHCSLGHMSRRGNRDPLLWNIACDHVVNLILKAAGEEIPDTMFCDDRFKGMPAEKVYRVLDDERRQQQQQEQQDDDDQEQDDTSQSDESDQGDQDQADDEGDDEEDNDHGDTNDNEDEDSGEGEGDDGEETDGDGQGDQPGGDSADEDGDQAGAGSGSSNADGDAGQQPSPQFNGDPGDCGEILDAAPSHDKAALDKAADEWQVFTQQAVNVAKRHGEGKVPGFAQQIVDHMNDPRADWRSELRRFVDPMSATKDFSWSNPNRRMLGLGYVMPGVISDGSNHGAVIIDSSGSTQACLPRFGAEIQSLLDDGTVDKITLIFCDTRVTKVAAYNKGDQIDFTVPGLGGTKFAPAFEWVAENASDVTFAVFFTDLECMASDYGDEPPYPVLFAACGNPTMIEYWWKQAPWGEMIDVGDVNA